MHPSTNGNNQNKNIYLTNAVTQLQDLVPKSISSSNKLTAGEKVERAKKISGIIEEVFVDLGSYGQAHAEIERIVALAQQAEKMQLLNSYRTTAYNHHLAQISAFPLDLTVTTRDGEIKINSYLLKKYSPVFKAMLESSMSEGQCIRFS